MLGGKKRKRKPKLDTTFLLENGMCIMHVDIFIYDVHSSIYWTCGSLHIFLKCKIRYLFISASQMSSLVLGILYVLSKCLSNQIEF